MGRGRRAAAAAMGLVLLVAGCASGSHYAKTSPVVGLGTPEVFLLKTGQHAEVSVVRVVDPGLVAQYQPAAPAGDRYVGVQITVLNDSGSNMVAALGGMTTVEDAAGASYSPSFADLQNCPAFSGVGITQVAPGATVTGCVVFALPTGSTVAKVVVGSAGLTPGIWSTGGS